MSDSDHKVVSLDAYRPAPAKRQVTLMWSFIVGIQPVIFLTPVWIPVAAQPQATR